MKIHINRMLFDLYEKTKTKSLIINISGGAVLEKEGVNKDTLHYIEPPRTVYQDFQIGENKKVAFL